MEGCGRKTFFSILLHLKTTTSRGRRLMDAKNIAAGIAGGMAARGGCTPLARGEKRSPLVPRDGSLRPLSIIQLIAAIYYHRMGGVNRTGTRIVNRDIMLHKGAVPRRREGGSRGG